MENSGQRLAFKANWYQEEAAMVRNYMLFYYLQDSAVELYDLRTNKLFMRRTPVADLSERDFFIGSKINLFGRQFTITGYGDEKTNSCVGKNRERTLLLLKNAIIGKVGEVVQALEASGFTLNKGVMVELNPEQVKAFLKHKIIDEGVGEELLTNQLLAGPCIAFEIFTDNAVEKILGCVRDVNGKEVPYALHQVFDSNCMRTGAYASRDTNEVQSDVEFFFGKKNHLNICNVWQNSTLGLIKPHVIKEGKLGKMLLEITKNGFKIAGLRILLIDRKNCEEFLEVYRGILPEYIPMTVHLSSGVSMALEIVSTEQHRTSNEHFREFCGPIDPEIAKLLRPHSLRAKFGSSKILNAIHCTDLPEDTNLELQYMFKLLENHD